MPLTGWSHREAFGVAAEDLRSVSSNVSKQEGTIKRSLEMLLYFII
jgi:hypothetical protein